MNNCFVCNNKFISKNHRVAKKYFYDICEFCGSGTLKPRAQVIRESQKEYQKNSYFDWGTLPAVKQMIYQIRFYDPYIDWIQKHVSKKGKIIDIGAGVTTFVQEMKQNKWDVYAQEISKQQSKIISKLLGKDKVFNGDFEKMRLPKDHFNVATMWHVLEHVKEPQQTMKQMHKILKRKGKIFIEVPNVDSINWTLFKDSYNLLDVPVHLFYFSETGLKKLFEQNGFSIEQIYQPYKFNSSFSVSLERYLAQFPLRRVVFYLSLPLSVIINLFACIFKSGEVIRVVAVKN